MNQSIDISGNWFFGRTWSTFSLLEKFAIVAVIAAPFFFLGVKHWITNVSMLASALAVCVLIRNRSTNELREIKNIQSIALIFFIYVIAIFVSQLGRQSFTLRDYLDQSRWVIGFPLFLFIYFSRINYAKALDWAAPVCIASAWVSSVYLIPSDAWGDRATVSFMDPLAFGFMNLSVGLMCFASSVVDVRRNNFSINTLLKIAAFGIGVYLSIRSGSRSGWAAFPMVILGVFYLVYQPGVKKVFFLIVAVFCALTVLYQFSATVQTRLGQLTSELMEYPYSGGVAPDTSVGLRITFYRLGFYYFSQSPLFGWGERGYGEIKDATALLSFSSQYARDFAHGALFHSEWTTQSVRFGIVGLLGVFWVFWMPIKAFLKFAKLGKDYLKIACMGLAYMTCQLAASWGDEVFNSKGMIIFTAIIVAGLLATGYSLQQVLQLTKYSADSSQPKGQSNPVV